MRQTTTLRLTASDREQLNQLAQQLKRPRHSLMIDAIRHFIRVNCVAAQ